MKLLWVLLVLLLPASAHAFPRSAQTSEDALADGEVDPDDLATASSLLRGVSRRPDALALGRGSAYVSLVGFARRDVLAETREVGGFVLVGLPLDRLARTTRASPLPEIVPAAAPSGDTAEIAVSSRLARGCVDAAWRAQGLDVEEGRLDAIVTRARMSALLPEARLRAVRFEDARLSLDTSTDTSRWRDSAGANIGFEARLTWRFDRLVYADDEPSLERIRIEHRDARTRIAGKVIDALVHWQRAMLDFRTLSPTQLGTRDEADVSIRVVEAEAVLDVLTGGWFSVHKPRTRGGTAAPRDVGQGI
jgi:hypothetical protein